MSKSKPGVLIVTWNFPPRTGGIENLLAGLRRGLQKDRRVLVLAAQAAGGGNEEWLLRPKRPGLAAFFLFAFCRGLAALWKNPDLEIILGGSALVAPLVLALAKLSGRKSAVLVHGLDLLYPRRIYQTLFVRWLKHCDRIVANSGYTSSLAGRRGVRKEAIAVIPPGVEAGSIPPGRAEDLKAELGLGGRKVLLSVGRLARRKGLKEFLQNSFPAVAAALPEAVFLIVGGNPAESLVHREDVRGELEGLVERMRLEDRVRFLGPIDDAALARVYRAADLMVLPALSLKDDVEGFGMVVIEAALAGVPAVATRSGGIPDAIEDGKSGVLVPPGDYPALTGAIVRMLR
ncbi:MAG TPA: glycosyltransferase family 4 protein, partial [Candidatus Binatia bacterium]